MSIPTPHVAEPLIPTSSAEADVVLSVNPRAGASGSRQRVDRLVELLEQRGFRVAVCTDLATAAAHADALSAQGRLRALVGVGGDGTAAELVNRTRPGTPLALMPAGTENLLARHFRMGWTPDEVAATIIAGERRQLDVGLASGRIFLLMASCGFDAEVVRQVHSNRTGHIRHWTYAKPILAAMRTYGFPEMRLSVLAQDGTEVSAPLPPHARWVFAFNLPCYGGGLCAVPDADPADGQLDVCTYGQGSLASGLRFASAIYFGRLRGLPDFTVGRVARVRITADQPVPYQLDGDPGGALPLELSVAAGRLTLLMPPAPS